MLKSHYNHNTRNTYAKTYLITKLFYTNFLIYSVSQIMRIFIHLGPKPKTVLWYTGWSKK